jgi:hypothetical protein
MNRTWFYILLACALIVAAYKFGVYVEASANQRVWDQHLSDDWIDNETVWQICTPRQEPPK